MNDQEEHDYLERLGDVVAWSHALPPKLYSGLLKEYNRRWKAHAKSDCRYAHSDNKYGHWYMGDHPEDHPKEFAVK